MLELFSKVEDFLTAVEAKAPDAARKGAASLRQLADFLEAVASGLKQAAPHEKEVLDGLLLRCKACHAVAAPGATEAPKPWVTVLLTLVETALQLLVKQG